VPAYRTSYSLLVELVVVLSPRVLLRRETRAFGWIRHEPRFKVPDD
jgi:hypothetical protein